MSIIKSYSVGEGDMFYIKHGSKNFTIIDCCLNDSNSTRILNEIDAIKNSKEITRFISTHPDDDHINGIEKLDDKISIVNFYCVKNDATKSDKTDSFTHYCKLRDSSKAYYIEEGCTRKWMNKDGEGDSGIDYGSSGINILWPKVANKYFREALEKTKNGESPNNISPIIKYALNGSVTALWMGDLESNFLENIKSEINFPKADILFAPHHGRNSGKIPTDVLGGVNTI